MKLSSNKGSITPALLIITGAFVIVIYGLLILLSIQLDFSHRQVASESSLHIADAGINYYLWHLTEEPEDYQDGTGVTGTYTHDYADSSGNTVGSFSLNIIPLNEASSIVTIESTGSTTDYPNLTRTIEAQFGKTSLTKYAVLQNSNLWFGNEVTLNGPVYSNGGIRQDGVNTSTVQSAKSTYTCGIESGCLTPTEKPGIWGSGGPSELWEYPTATVDFDSITIDFNQMKSESQSVGLYLEPSEELGYHLVFLDNGDVSVYKVTGTDFYKAFSYENGCVNLYEVTTSEDFLGTYAVTDNPIIFIEDDLWIDGVLNGETTVVAARFPIDTDNADIIINENLTYVDYSGDHTLGLISQKDIIFGRDVPDYFEVNGALLAQKGRVIRHHYGYIKCKSPGGDKIKKQFSFFGSSISSLRAYWNFSGGPQNPAAGFQETIFNYDTSLSNHPPEYFPEHGEYELVSWEEK